MHTFAGTAEALAERIHGRVFLPGTEGFDEEVACWNRAVTHRPAVAVGVADADDVATAIRWADAHGLRVAVHSTGHGPSAAADGGVLISTRRLSSVTVNPHDRTARIGAGAKWAQVIEAAAPYGLAPLNGSSSDVGAVGYCLGGGVGLMVRKYGFAADHIRSVQLVTADGLIRTVDATHDPDLFWAVRGAGKGRFGVVTEIEVELVPVTRLYGGGIYYPATAASAVLHAFGPWTAGLSDDTTVSVAMLRLPDVAALPEPIRGRFVVHLRVAHLGSAAEGERILAPMRAVAPALIDTVAEMPYSAVDAIHSDPVDPMPGYDAGVLLKGLPVEAVDALLAAAGPQVQVPLAVVELRLLGGAAARPPLVPNAVRGREGAFSLLTLGPMVPGLEQLVPAVARTVLEAVEPFTADTALANFPPPATGSGADSGSGSGSGSGSDEFSGWPLDDRDRLVMIRKKFDPTTMFAARR